MDRKLVVLVLVFFLVIGAFMTAVFYDQGSIQGIKAANKCAPDASKSFVVSLPKDVPAGGACEVDVFVRCADESSVANAQVSIQVANGSASPTTSLTDETGKATFSVKGQGLASITARVNDALDLSQNVTCNFLQ